MDYESDANCFSDLMANIAEMYGQPMTKTKTRIYFDALQKLSIEQVRTAISIHQQDTRRGMYMPKPAELIKHITGDFSGKLAPSERFRQRVRAQGRVVRF